MKEDENMPNEREVAIYILSDIFDNNAYSNIALRKILKEKNLNQTQKAFVTEIVNGTLRNLIHIDYIIDCYSKTKTIKMKPLILNILRISVYQAKYMSKVPPSAICNEAVKLTKSKGFMGLSGFVNGVMRNIIRNVNNISYPDEKTDPVKYLSVYYSYPQWIIEYWLQEMDYDKIKEICIIQNTSPMVSVCVNTLKIDKQSLIKRLELENIIVEDSTSNIIRISKTSNIQNTECFKEGLFHVMDKSSATAVEMLKPKPNDIMIDICAAPGGKSFYAAYMMENKGRIIARDIYDHKLKLVEEQAKRLGIQIICTENKNATDICDQKLVADVVLLDVPCSGLGILRKKPDAKYNKTMEQIDSLQSLQREILSKAYEYVKLGGTLIYSTCTISKKENLDNIQWFVSNYPFEVVEVKHILPQIDADGFFITKMIRK